MSDPNQTKGTKRMSRDAFPFSRDREEIRAFLTAKPLRERNPLSDQYVFYQGSSLVLQVASSQSATTVAWFGPDGSLMGKLGMDLATAYTVRVLNVLLDTLHPSGIAPQITRETRPNATGRLMNVYFYDDQPIEIDQPFVIAGPLGIAAFRS